MKRENFDGMAKHVEYIFKLKKVKKKWKMLFEKMSITVKLNSSKEGIGSYVQSLDFKVKKKGNVSLQK